MAEDSTKRTAKRCAVYGTSGAFGKPGYAESLEKAKAVIDDLIEKGIKTFVTDSRDGFELELSVYILNKKQKDPDVHLVVAKPYPDFNSNWRTRPILQEVIDKADMVKYISKNDEEYSPDLLDRWTLSHCDTVLYITRLENSKINRLTEIDISDKTIIYVPEKPESKPITKGGELDLNDIVVATVQVPGTASFDNYEELKSYLKTGLETYNTTMYSLDNIDQARHDHWVLKSVRKKLTDTKKAILAEYSVPIELVIQQLDELIKMVNGPYQSLDRMLKTNAKEIKRHDIMSYAQSKSYVLGKYANSVLSSPAFLNPKWCNASYSDTKWKREVDAIIEDARCNIEHIVSDGYEDVGILLGYYFEKLSLDGIESFLYNVRREETARQPETVFIDVNTGEIVEKIEEQDTAKVAEIKEEIPEMQPEAELTDETKAEDIIIHKKVMLSGTSDQIRRYIALADQYNVIVDDID